MRFDPQEPAESRQRSLRAVEGTRRADSLRGVGRSRAVPARGAAEAARGSTPISKGTRRRGCRSSTSRPDRSGRASAPAIGIALNARRIESPTTAPTCCSATARWPKARSGKPPTSALHYKLDNLCAIIDVNGARPEPGHAVRARHGRARRALGRVRLARHRHRRPRHRRRCSTRFDEARATTGQPTMILARTLKGKGISFDRRQGRLARQGAQEGRGSRQGDRRAGGAVRRRTRRSRAIAEARADEPARRTPADYVEAAGAGLQAGRPGRHARSVRHRARRARRRRRAHRRARCRREELDLQRQVREGASRIASIERFIAEQVMVGAAMGLAARGAIPFPSTFAAS